MRLLNTNTIISVIKIGVGLATGDLPMAGKGVVQLVVASVTDDPSSSATTDYGVGDDDSSASS
jgi:hypothetical protein